MLYSGRSIGPAFTKGIGQKIAVAETAAGTLTTRVHHSMIVTAPGLAFSPLGKQREKLGSLGETTGDALGNGIRDSIRRKVRESTGDSRALQSHVRTAGGIDLHSRGSISVDSWSDGAGAGGDYSIRIQNLTASSEREAVRQLETRRFKQKIRRGRS